MNTCVKNTAKNSSSQINDLFLVKEKQIKYQRLLLITIAFKCFHVA